MTYAGARGNTAVEMEKTLHFSGNDSKIHAEMKSLNNRFDTEAIESKSGVIDVANRLWFDKRENLKADYKALVAKYYGAGVETVDFFKAHQSARQQINEWVSKKTRGRIKNLLKENNVSSNTKLILVNAIYFNSSWLYPFDKALTKDKPFYTGKNKQITVPIMFRSGRYLYGENAEMQWLKIPYKISGLSMLILLPRENESFTQIEELEKKLTPQIMTSLSGDMKYSEVALRMPKFKSENRYTLSDVLKILGMKSAFTNDADFSGMIEKPVVNGPVIHIDYVVHEAFIEIDEEKTEAAAATAVGIKATAAIISQPVMEFNVNRPFIYCLTDEQTGVILFMGRMEQP
jgi:serpin B